MFDNVWLHQYQTPPPSPSASKNYWYEDLVKALTEPNRRIIGDFQLFISNGNEAQRHIKWLSYATAAVNLILISDFDVGKKQRSFGWKIVQNIEPTYLQCAIYIDISSPWDANLDYLTYFRTELAGIISGFLFMLRLIQYFEINPEPDSSVTVYCNNVSSLFQVDTSLRKRGTRHHMIPEYNLVKTMQWCINKLRIGVDPEQVKGHQDCGSQVNTLSYPSRMNIPCDKLAGKYLSGICIPEPTTWNVRDSAPFFTFPIFRPHHKRPSFYHRHWKTSPPWNQRWWYLLPHHQSRELDAANIELRKLGICCHRRGKRTRHWPASYCQVFSWMVSPATEHRTPILFNDFWMNHFKALCWDLSPYYVLQTCSLQIQHPSPIKSN